MGLNAIKNAINTIIKSNTDGINVIKDGVNVSIGEVRCIYEGKTISIWKKNKYYYLTFHPNSGIGTMPDQTMPCGTAAALSANLFSRIGYLFQGWNTDADGDAVYTDGQEVTDIAGAGETLTLYAIWKAITWYVKFHANGGSGSMANQAHAYDTELALSENAFTRSEYTFLGWGTTASGAVAYGDQQAVKNLKSVHGAVLNLYAIWQKDPWTVVFTDHPISKTEVANDNGTAKITTADSGYTLSVKKHPDTVGFGAIEGAVTLPTQGCNKVRISYIRSYCTGASINGTELTVDELLSVREGTLVLDCSGDTFTLIAGIVESTAYYTAELKITEIYFYNE